MDKTLKELTETLNRSMELHRSEEEVEGKVNYLIRVMNEEGTDNIQSGGLYVLKDEELKGYEVGIHIPVNFITYEGEVKG